MVAVNRQFSTRNVSYRKSLTREEIKQLIDEGLKLISVSGRRLKLVFDEETVFDFDAHLDKLVGNKK